MFYSRLVIEGSGFAALFVCVHADQEVLIGTLLDLPPSLSLFGFVLRPAW